MQFGQVKRREIMALLGGAAAALPLSAHAQQQITEKLLTIGILGSSAPSTQSRQNAALVQRLHELGWTEGGNVKIEVR